MILFPALVTKLTSSRKASLGATHRCGEVLSQAGELLKDCPWISVPKPGMCATFGSLSVDMESVHSPLHSAPRRDPGLFLSTIRRRGGEQGSASLSVSLHHFWKVGHLQLYELKNGQFIGLSLIPKPKKNQNQVTKTKHQ